jgi:hypothetical protein
MRSTTSNTGSSPESGKSFSDRTALRARAFRDPNGSNRVGLIIEIPDFAAFEQLMQTEGAAEAMKHDGVHPETLLVLGEE